jgi:hypothetical membrane protein
MSVTAQTPVGRDVQLPPRTSALVALAGIIGPVWFTTLVVVQGFLQPDYSHVRLPISALAAWPTGWIQSLNFYVAGALTIVFAWALHRAVQPTRRGAAGIASLMTGGVGVMLAGLFPWRMVDGVPTETPPHVVGAVMAFAGTGLGIIVVARRLRADRHWHDLAAYTTWTGIAVLLLFVAVGFFAIADGTPLHPWAGLLQRILCAIWFGWMIAVAIRLRAISGAASRSNYPLPGRVRT